MESNEIIQWSAVCLIVLAALVWVGFRVARLNRHKEGECGCCDQASDCKAKEIKNLVKRREAGNCRDGQSARN